MAASSVKMANIQQGYPPQGYQEGGAQPEDGTSQQAYDQQAGTAGAGGKKKRAYAGQAFEFGTGANVAGAAQQQPPPPGGAYAGAQPAAYGYPQQQPQMGYQQPTYGDQAAQAAQPAYAQPAYGAGGYQAPEPSYPAQAASMLQGGVGAMTQQFGNMGMGMGGGAQQQPQVQPQQPTHGAPTMQRLNPLQPVDISAQGQPFHVADLDLPPPQLILPPNVSRTPTL